MIDRLPRPSTALTPIRWAHAECERERQFAAFVDRLAAREAERDPDTGLTETERLAEWTYRSRCRLAYHHRVESPHNPLRAA